MISFAGLGAAVGVSVGVADGVGVGVGLAVTVDGVGVTSGEFVAVWLFAWVQLVNSNIKPATTAAGTPPLLKNP